MRIILTGFLIFALTIAASVGTAQEAAPDAAAAAFLESLKLAPEHARLTKLVGKWTTETRSYFPDPSKPSVSKGTATFIALLDGRYVQQTFKGEFAGMAFQGIGVTGFDKTKKKYVSTWIDNFETGIMTMEGTYDEKTKTTTEYGITRSAEGEMKMKNVTREIDNNTFVFSMYMVLPDGKENLSMEITYRRVK